MGRWLGLGMSLYLLSSSPRLWAQEQHEKQEPSLAALKIALQRSREATARCEDNLAELWAQAMELKKQYDALLVPPPPPGQAAVPPLPDKKEGEKPQ